VSNPGESVERQQIEQLYRQYGPVVYRRALALLRNREEAMDVMQDVFVTGLSRGDTFRGDCSPLTWLYAITTHRCLNRIRSRNRQQRALSSLASLELAWTGLDAEQLHLLCDALDRLPRRLAEVAIYYYLDDLTQQEIATLIDCSPRQVSRMLARLARLVSETGEVRDGRAA
jgi:RNA polymerase sigma-70 factor (ECF subfamily)